MLRMKGNKQKIIEPLLSAMDLSDCKIFIDMFAGTLSVSLNVIKRYPTISIYASDNDLLMYNLYLVLLTKREELEKRLKYLPKHSEVFKFFKQVLIDSQNIRLDGFNCNVVLAIAYLYNIYGSLYSSGSTIQMGHNNHWNDFIKSDVESFLKELHNMAGNIMF